MAAPCGRVVQGVHKMIVKYQSFPGKMSPLSHQYHQTSRMRKKAKLSTEDERTEQFREFIRILNQAKSRYYQGTATATASGSQFEQSSGVESQHTLLESSQTISTKPTSSTQPSTKKKSRRKSKLKFDVSKPMLNESLSPQMADMVPEVKTILGDKVTSKISKRRLTKEQKHKLFNKLLATHPFIEHMQSGEEVEIDPDVLEELREIMDDDMLSAELRQMIVEYLARAEDHVSDDVTPGDEDVFEALANKDKGNKLDNTTRNKDEMFPHFEPLGDLTDPIVLKDTVNKLVKVFHTRPVSKQEYLEKAKCKEEELQIEQRYQNLSAYIDVCIFTRDYSKAHSILMTKNLDKKRRSHWAVKDATVYNTLMHAYAKENKLHEIRELFQFLEKTLKPDLQSYAAVLECLGRQGNIDLKLANIIINNISHAGFNVHDIRTSCKLTSDEWKHIKRVLEVVEPDFTETPVNSNSDASHLQCKLVNMLDTSKPVLSPVSGLLSTPQLHQKASTQLGQETGDNIVSVKSVHEPRQLTTKIITARARLDSVKKQWRTDLEKAFKRELQRLSDENHTELPFLRLFPVSTYVDIMMQEIEIYMEEMARTSPPISRIKKDIGNSIYYRFKLTKMHRSGEVQQLATMYKSYLSEINQETVTSNPRQIIQNIAQQMNWERGRSTTVQWTSSINSMIGRLLLKMIMSETKIDANLFKKTDEVCEIPALYSVVRSGDHGLSMELLPHPVLVRLHKATMSSELKFRTSFMPYLVPPMPYMASDMGGNIMCTTELAKYEGYGQSDRHPMPYKTVPDHQLYPVFDALNDVSSIPWKINEPMLDLLIEVFTSGGNMSLDIAEFVESSTPPPATHKDMTYAEIRKVNFERKRLSKEKRNMYSLWCNELYRLSIANKFRNDFFWFPHQMDFRSRFYPVPPYFTHLGGDIARCMLLFAHGKPLGTKGLDWLKIHLINLTGLKKRSSNQERLQYADSIMDDILDSAHHPLTGGKWWQSSDDPWQTLACCKEIANASRSPDHTQYISHLPVHQDGSCNGLQHYAALGRDEAGAKSVNLFPYTQPSDVYSDVVEMVEKEREIDAENGIAEAQALEGFVKRKVIKQTIMTTVYGVTRYGAKLQIANKLEDYPQFKHDGHRCARYLADKTFEVLLKMFTPTRQIQVWMVACADLASRVRSQPIEWVTPVMFPVEQPYFKMIKVDSKTKHRLEKPNAMKQRNAFPPNFIHSLDSTHMMLTALQCLREGIQFVAVHDSFWTHAIDIETMNKACREQFIALHREPVLEDLSTYLVQHFGFPPSDITSEKRPQIKEAKRLVNKIFLNVPEKGTFDLEKVRDSTYFFS